MLVNFNYYDQADDVTLILCNPSGDQLMVLGTVYDRKVTYRFNALSSLEFIAPYMINGVETPYYSLIQSKRLVLIDGIMCFLITEINEYGDGIKKYKEVKCQSLESIMNYKKVTSFEGTYQFYDALGTSASPALLNTLIEYIPGWTIGTVDTELAILYRTFDIDDTTLYSFLTNDISETYQCIFKFDTLNKTISAYTIDNATTDSDIFISYDNLIKETEVKEITDELVTCLTVTGGGDLSINSVNPLGTNKIYNFSYFENTNWMSASLITSLNSWEALIISNQSNYASLLTSLQNYNETLLTQRSELTDLQSEYKALENVKISRISQGLDLTDINNQLAAKQVEIDAKNTAILLTQSQITSTTSDLTDINTALSFDTNFSTAAQEELSNFMFGSTYTNENFIQTSIMSNSEIQDQAQRLYNQAIEVLEKISQPRYEFTLDAVNFTSLKEYLPFTNQLELGTIVTLDIGGESNIYESDYVSSSGSHTMVYPALLEISMNYDNPSDFSLTFSNRLRIDNSNFQLSDLLNSNNTSSVSTSFNSEQWSSWTKNYQDDVSSFIISSLDTARNNVVSGSTQNVLIDQTGIRVRNLISASTISSSAIYDPKQLWMNNGIICFTKDGWQTSSLALGEVDVNGTKYYGVVGDALVGKMLIGNNLYMTNQNNSFLFDSSGATLTNATLSLATSSGNNKILLDPNNGIKIQKNIGGTWTDQFYLDPTGNVTMTGQIIASSGSIGGWAILSDRLKDNLGNYIRSDGYIKLGLLTITPTSATFDGTVYANRINGYLTSDQISSLIASKISGTLADSQIGSGLGASKITYGAMSGDRVTGGIIQGVGTGTQIKLDTSNMMYLNANTGVHINGGGAQIQANSAIITLYGGNGINLTGNTKLNNNLEVVGATTIGGYTRINDSAYIDGTLQVTDRVYSNITSSGTSVFSRADINSSLYANGSIGITNTFTVLVAGGSRSFQFRYGILIGSSFIP